jgi:CubicO group peptidase (beta-lactamase class C family)
MKNLIILLILFPTALIAQENHRNALDRYMKAEASVNGFSGTILVKKAGELIYENAFGFADREWNIPNTPQTKFQIGSVTKQFTAAAILQLAEEGKISLDDKLSTYIPGFARGDSITIHTMLIHTSGLKDYEHDQSFLGYAESLILTKTPHLQDSLINYFRNNPYDFPVGSKWSYSNTGYYLLGCIIEKLSGLSFSDYVEKHIIQKAGLENTFVNRWDTIVPNRARGYIERNGKWENAGYMSMEIPFSAGSILSTTEDLYKWNKALFSNKIINRSSVELMTTPHTPSPILGNYAYGLFVDEFSGHPRIGHPGGIYGFASYLVSFPSEDITIIVLSNNESTMVPLIVDAISAILFDLPVKIPVSPKE